MKGMCINVGITLPPTHFLHAACSLTTKFHVFYTMWNWKQILQTFSDSSDSGLCLLCPQVEALPVSHKDRCCHTPFPQMGMAFGGRTSSQLCLTVHLMRKKAGAPSREMTRVLGLRERERENNRYLFVRGHTNKDPEMRTSLLI